MTEEPKKINKKIRLLPTVGHAVNSLQCAFTVPNFIIKEPSNGTNRKVFSGD